MIEKFNGIIYLIVFLVHFVDMLLRIQMFSWN